MCKGAKKKYILKLAGAALLLAAAVGIGGTSALIREAAEKKNTVRTLKVGVVITEGEESGRGNSGTSVGEKKKNISFENTDTADVFIRVACAENWESSGDGENVILPNNNEEGNAIVEKEGFTLGEEENWQKGDDGWYYYKKVLPAGGQTLPVLTSVNFGNLTEAGDDGGKYNSANYRIHFQVEAVQASSQLDVAEGAAEAIFGMKPCPQKNGAPLDKEQWRTSKDEAEIIWDSVSEDTSETVREAAAAKRTGGGN